jgi:hypothetical protein
MKLVQRMLMGFGGIALTATLLSLVAPRAAHALAATLVQVANTAAAPGVTQDVSRLASQNIAFSTTLQTGGLAGQLQVVGKDGVVGSFYTVPAGQTLIITSVDFLPLGAFNFAPVVTLRDFSNQGSSYSLWWAPPGVTAAGAVSSQFTYPAGIAIQSGITPSLTASQGWTGNLFIQLRGYLTSI